ncbi:hypothetical protein [Celeribacter sp.]|uniref:hypothetical protein n=1 Tax=Celeribacter sp. TaxID=1890673 RepID=UPI003A8CA5E8
MSLNYFSALTAFLVLLLVARGFLPLLSMRKRDFLSYATLGIALIASATIGRAAYWDLTRLVVGPEVWAAWVDASGGVTVNVVPNIMVLAGGVALLKARFLLIPEEDRANWNLFTAAFYPARKCIAVRIGSVWRDRK